MRIINALKAVALFSCPVVSCDIIMCDLLTLQFNVLNSDKIYCDGKSNTL